MINIYPSTTNDFNNNGTVLHECISCISTKELNKLTSIELVYPLDKRGKYLELKGLNIIKAGGQLYRIPLQNNIQAQGNSVKVNANHIFYDLNNDFNLDTRADNKSVAEALQIAIAINPKFSVGICDDLGFNTAYFITESPTQSIFNKILERWGGELLCDNFEVSVKAQIGRQSGILISYGKNIQGFEQTLDWSELTTRILVKGKDGLVIDLVNSGDSFLVSPRVNDYPFIITKEVKFEGIEDATELKAAALKLWGVIDLPSVNYKVNFLDLAKTVEYAKFKDMLKLKIGDSVIIRHELFKCDLTARVIKVVRDEITDIILNLELGQFKNNISNKFSNIDKQIAFNQSSLLETREDLKLTKTTVFQNDERISLQAEAINIIDDRVDAAELKITAEAITSTIRSSTAYIDDLGEKVTAEQSSAIAQTAENVKIGFNGISDNIIMDPTGLIINGGALIVKNANGKTVVDGSKLMFHIVAYGNGALSAPVGAGATVTIPHNLGYVPNFRGQVFIGNPAKLFPVPNFQFESTGGGYTIDTRFEMSADATNLYMSLTRSPLHINGGTLTMSYRYFLYDGATL